MNNNRNFDQNRGYNGLNDFNDKLKNIKFEDKLECLKNEKLFSDYPEELAEEVSKSEVNSITQIRKFYDELNMWDEKITNQDEYEKNKVLFKMMKAKIAYSKGRKHIDEKFSSLFNHCIDQVDSTEKLTQFKFFFEAFMGYYRVLR